MTTFEFTLMIGGWMMAILAWIYFNHKLQIIRSLYLTSVRDIIWIKDQSFKSCLTFYPLKPEARIQVNDLLNQSQSVDEKLYNDLVKELNK